MTTTNQQGFLDRLLDNADTAERNCDRATAIRDEYRAAGHDTSATSASSPCSLDYTVAKMEGRLAFARKEAVKYATRIGVVLNGWAS